MKKKSLLCCSSIAILLASLLTLSCERETILLNEAENLKQLEIDGLLSFDSFEEFSQTATKLNFLTFNELEQWCKKNSFISQELLFRKLIQKEDQYEESIIDMFGKDVSQEYLNSEINLEEHVGLYYELLSKGIIREVGESDDSKSYETTVINPVYMSVINESGLVVINTEIYQFFDAGVKIIHDGNPEKIGRLSNLNNSNEKLGISVINLRSDLKGYGHSFNLYDEHVANRKRVTFRVYFHAGENGVYYEPANCIMPTYYVECRAQKKNIWGNWVYKNNFKPITEVSGSWTYRFQMVEFGDPFHYQYIYSVTDPDSQSSPLFYDYFSGMGSSTNYFKTTCVPDGWFCAPSGWFMDECTVYNHSFRMRASGYSDLVLP